MKKTILILMAAALLAACRKDAEKLPDPDFELRFSKTAQNGQATVIVDRAINVSGTVEATPRYNVKQAEIELSMGLIPATTTTPRLKATFIVRHTANPAQAAGVYNLPADGDKLYVSLSESLNAGTVIRTDITSGKVTLRYDAARKTFSGDITDLRFPTPSNSNYTALALNGWFQHAALQP